MGSGVVPYYMVFLLQLLFCSGSSLAEIPSLEAIQKNQVPSNLENQMLFPSPTSISKLYAVPVVIPTVPGTTPMVNPSISPPAPAAIIPPPPATHTAPATATAVSGAWCIASPTASQTALQVALDYACGYGGADCSALQTGASCYNPNTVLDHASYAFNDYYQKNPISTSCVFSGTAQLTYTDPSNGNCHYASPTSTSTSPPVTSTPTITTPTTTTPTITTPTTTTPTITTPTTTILSPPATYGVAEPTGSPSSATSISCSLVPLCYAIAALVLLF